MWLNAYHNTSLDEVVELHPEWKDNSKGATNEFYSTYAVTQQQHDEWYGAAIKAIAKDFKISQKAAKRGFSFTYLNTAPYVKD